MHDAMHDIHLLHPFVDARPPLLRAPLRPSTALRPPRPPTAPPMQRPSAPADAADGGDGGDGRTLAGNGGISMIFSCFFYGFFWDKKMKVAQKATNKMRKQCKDEDAQR